MLLFLQTLQHRYRGVDPVARKRMPRADLDMLLTITALAWNLKEDIVTRYPLTSDLLQMEFLDRIRDDGNLQLELESAVHDRSSTFRPEDISKLQGLLQERATMHAPGCSATRLDLDTAQLEEKTMQLDLERLRHDADAYRVWRDKCRAVEISQYYQVLEWRQKVQDQGRTFARKWLARHVQFTSFEKTGATILKEFQGFTTQVATQLVLPQPELATVGFLNWASLSTIPAPTQRLQVELLDYLCNSERDPCSVALCVMPQHSYKKAQLYLSEIQALRQLGHARLNFDRKFTLKFAGPTDLRDKRPAHYDGRLVLGHTHTQDHPFVHSALHVNGSTEAVTRLRPTDMLVFEDPGEEALPTPGDLKHPVGISQRYKQLGPIAHEVLLRSLLENTPLPNRCLLALVDLTPDVGDVVRGYVQCFPSLSVPSCCFAVVDNPAQTEFIMHQLEAQVADMWLGKILQTPDSPPEKELPKEARTTT